MMDLAAVKETGKSEFGEEEMFLDIYNFFRMEMNSGSVLGYFLQALPSACIVGLVFLAIRSIILKKKKSKKSLILLKLMLLKKIP